MKKELNASQETSGHYTEKTADIALEILQLEHPNLALSITRGGTSLGDANHKVEVYAPINSLGSLVARVLRQPIAKIFLGKVEYCVRPVNDMLRREPPQDLLKKLNYTLDLYYNH